ncbi:MAG: hypothetical protein WC373_06645 [Smithella sp.]|jgi:hypothetical protein
MGLEQSADGTATAPDAAAQGQNAAPAWLAQVSDDLKSNETLTGYQTISDLAKDTLSLKEKAAALEGKLTTDYIPKLTENATDEQRAVYKAAMGIPDKPEDYDIPVPEGQSTELADALRAFAHEKSLPKGYVKDTVEWWNGLVTQKKEAYTKELQTRIDGVRTKWGADYDKNAEAVKSLFQAVKDAGINEFATLNVVGPDNKPMPLGNHPAVMEFFLEMAKKTLPDSGVRSMGGSDSRTLDERAKDFYKT